MNAPVRRLPRSNAPHPDESLAGYILNLAYRLDITPKTLITSTGLKARGAGLLDVRYAIEIPDSNKQRFATATGLTEHEVTRLTLQRFVSTAYEPHRDTALARTLHGNLWIDVARTRFCPQCLADDNENAPHHVTWRIDWLTPWALACTRHRTLLFDACPACHTPTGDSGRGFKSAIPHVHAPVTHPAACRAKAEPHRLCDNRLDQATPDTAPQPVLDLQETLNRALNGTPSDLTSLGQHVDAPQYLRDLRLTTILLQMTDAENVADLATHLDPTLQQAALNYVSIRREPDVARTKRVLTQPPDHINAAAGLLLVAADLLSHRANRERLARLSSRADSNEHQSWKKAQNVTRPSPALSAALHDTRNAITDPKKNRTFATNTVSFELSHIPAYLNDATFTRHFADTDRQYQRPLRRWVPIALARLASDLTTYEAAQTLGYDAQQADAATARASNAFDRIGHDELRHRLTQVGDELSTQPPVNYQRRRDHFDSNWLINTDMWSELQSTLHIERLARTDTPWMRRRPAYAAWIWSLVTEGDLLSAPMIQQTSGGRRSTNGVAKDISDLIRRTPPRHHAIVESLAQEVISNIG